MKSLLILVAITLALSTRANAATFTVSDGQEVIVAVDPTAGVTIQLPTFVRVVTPPRQFSVTPILAPGPVIANNAAQDTLASTDVRAFIVKATGKQNSSERITFMLADEKNVTVHFKIQAGSDNFIDLRYPRQNQSSRAKLDGGFLASERNLMLTLLRDTPGAAREVVNTEIKLNKYPDLRIVILRQFQSDGLTGYVFTVTNTGSKTLQLNAPSLEIGLPNRAVLTQVDHETLKPCKQDNSTDPIGTGCLTAMRMVIRGQTSELPTISSPRSSMPFVAIDKDAKEMP